jgi:hypothetical protein
MSGLGKQLRGTGIAKIQNQRTPFEHGGKALKEVDSEKNPGLAKLPTEVRNKMGYMKKGGSANWIQSAIKKPGSLRASLHVKKGEKIPAKKLSVAAKKPGITGKRARLAQTLKGLKK